MKALCLEPFWPLAYASLPLSYFNLYPFSVISHKYEQNSFHWVLWVLTNCWTWGWLQEAPELAVGVRSQGNLEVCLFKNFAVCLTWGIWYVNYISTKSFSNGRNNIKYIIFTDSSSIEVEIRTKSLTRRKVHMLGNWQIFPNNLWVKRETSVEIRHYWTEQ